MNYQSGKDFLLHPTYLHNFLAGKDEVAVVDVDHVEATAHGEGLLEQVIAVFGAKCRQNANVLKMRKINVNMRPLGLP